LFLFHLLDPNHRSLYRIFPGVETDRWNYTIAAIIFVINAIIRDILPVRSRSTAAKKTARYSPTWSPRIKSLVRFHIPSFLHCYYVHALTKLLHPRLIMVCYRNFI
jgi:hypothetical protein